MFLLKSVSIELRYTTTIVPHILPRIAVATLTMPTRVVFSSGRSPHFRKVKARTCTSPLLAEEDHSGSSFERMKQFGIQTQRSYPEVALL